VSEYLPVSNQKFDSKYWYFFGECLDAFKKKKKEEENGASYLFTG